MACSQHVFLRRCVCKHPNCQHVKKYRQQLNMSQEIEAPLIFCACINFPQYYLSILVLILLQQLWLEMPPCHYCQKVPPKLLHVFIQQFMLLEWPSRISRVLHLTISILPARICYKCKGRIENFEKPCVELAGFRASVRAAMEVGTNPPSLKRTKDTGGEVVVQILSSMMTAHT